MCFYEAFCVRPCVIRVQVRTTTSSGTRISLGNYTFSRQLWTDVEGECIFGFVEYVGMSGLIVQCLVPSFAAWPVPSPPLVLLAPRCRWQELSRKSGHSLSASSIPNTFSSANSADEKRVQIVYTGDVAFAHAVTARSTSERLSIPVADPLGLSANPINPNSHSRHISDIFDRSISLTRSRNLPLLSGMLPLVSPTTGQ